MKFEYEMATGSFAYSWAVPLSGPGSGSVEECTAIRKQIHASGPSVNTPPLTGHPPLLARETEIFVPSQLAQGRKLIVEGLRDGDTYTYDMTRQTLFVLPASQATGEQGNMRAHVHQVSVRFDPPAGGKLPNDFWGDFAVPISAVMAVILAVATYFIL